MNKTAMTIQFQLFENRFLEKVNDYPKFRYMGSKNKLLPWIYDSIKDLPFDTVLDGFSGSGAVSYMLKTMGKEVTSNDFLHFAYTISKATIENNAVTLTSDDIAHILTPAPNKDNFILKTFKGIFFTEEDLGFLDSAYYNISKFDNGFKKYLGLASLIRACIKKQPRGVFTVSGDLSNYDDGRRDLQLSMREHFVEQVAIFNGLVFNNNRKNISINEDIFEIKNPQKYDLIYLDPPYVPRSDDNCYVKRYHFLEGLSKYWQDEEIMMNTKVKKIKKKYTPFSYRSKAINAFDQMFDKFQKSIIVLSYSSNGYPDINSLKNLLSRYKEEIVILKKEHKYHFGNHKNAQRSKVEEYLIVGK